MATLEEILREARLCRTKSAWEEFFDRRADYLSGRPDKKALVEIFRLLKTDPYCLSYASEIWETLLQACLNDWNLALGCEVAELAVKSSNPKPLTLSVQIFLEAGHPQRARELAQRTLRLVGLSVRQQLDLELLIAASFAEEGKHQKALKLLSTVTPKFKASGLTEREHAEVLARIGRLYFFMGCYLEAAERFLAAAPIFKRLEDLSEAARAFFNAAACFSNSAGRRRLLGFQYVEECRRLSVQENLKGPLSHCEAFYGVEAYKGGNFLAAREHFRKAIKLSPTEDHSFRRLHLLSMLALCYLAEGQYQLAKKFGHQTLALASQDESSRFRSRYVTLEAQLLWEEGEVERSQAVLNEVLPRFEQQGINNWEDVETFSRLIMQGVLCDHVEMFPRIHVAAHLHHNHYHYLGYLYACHMRSLALSNVHQAEDGFRDLLERAKVENDLYHEACARLGIVTCHLRLRNTMAAVASHAEFVQAAEALGDISITGMGVVVQAGIAYQMGHIAETHRHLKLADKNTRLGFAEHFAVRSCLETLEGKSPRIIHPWQQGLVAFLVRNYFAPTLEILAPGQFRISRHYDLDLSRFPALAELLTYLAGKTSHTAGMEEIQSRVWRERLSNQGWRQKIRNAIMRLRDLCPYTLAPLFIHSGELRIFTEAIEVVSLSEQSDELPAVERITQLLRSAPLSSQQVSDKLNISLATTKRLLRKLTDDGLVSHQKLGRNILYELTMH